MLAYTKDNRLSFLSQDEGLSVRSWPILLKNSLRRSYAWSARKSDLINQPVIDDRHSGNGSTTPDLLSEILSNEFFNRIDPNQTSAPHKESLAEAKPCHRLFRPPPECLC